MNKSILSGVLLVAVLQLVSAYVLGVSLGKSIVIQPMAYSQPDQTVGAINNALTTITNPFNFTQGLAIGSSTPTQVNSNRNVVVGVANSTSTAFFGRLCFATQTEGSGSGYLYYYTSTSTGNAAVTGWATSTRGCYTSN